MEDGTLTAEQVSSWRKILCLLFGPYALIMPDSDVQKMRDLYQRLEAEKFLTEPAETPLRKTYPPA